MTVPKYNCICDTNIWVNVCLGGVHESYISKYSNIGVAEVVKNEIIKWESNESKYKKIYTYFCEYENEDILVINSENFHPQIRKIIEKDLVLWGFNDLDNSSKNIKNLGEFVSLLYAYHLEVPYIHTHDIEFCDMVKIDELYDQYKDLELITWHEISEKITSSHTEKLALTKRVENESKTMKRQTQNHKEQQEMNLKLDELLTKFSKKN